MITLKIRNYNRKEKAILAYILREGLRQYCENCREYCEFCQNPNACSDIDSALKFFE